MIWWCWCYTHTHTLWYTYARNNLKRLARRKRQNKNVRDTFFFCNFRIAKKTANLRNFYRLLWNCFCCVCFTSLPFFFMFSDFIFLLHTFSALIQIYMFRSCSGHWPVILCWSSGLSHQHQPECGGWILSELLRHWLPFNSNF